MFVFENLSYDYLNGELSESKNLYSGLQTFKKTLKPYGVGALAYGFMLHATSHLRVRDYLLYATFREEIRNIGESDGGSLSFRFADINTRLTSPLFFDLDSTLEGKGPLYSHNKTYQAIYDLGYRHAWMVPFGNRIDSGIGHMILFQDHTPKSPKIDIEKLFDYPPMFHNIMMRHKQIAKHFRLSQKQIEALSWASKGKPAAYLAEKLGLSERSIELRLQSARQKLIAKTTAEAVYKALAYGILPLKYGPEH